MIKYIRDGRAPIPDKDITSKIMSSIRGKNTKPELVFRKSLYHNGLSGYRLHWKKAPGCPDICYPGRKIAIFVHGCFWHMCPYCKPPLPKSHVKFWNNKLKRNKERDKKKVNDLKAIGWIVLEIWECQIRSNLEDCIRKVNSVMEV